MTQDLLTNSTCPIFKFWFQSFKFSFNQYNLNQIAQSNWLVWQTFINIRLTLDGHWDHIHNRPMSNSIAIWMLSDNKGRMSHRLTNQIIIINYGNYKSIILIITKLNNKKWNKITIK